MRCISDLIASIPTKYEVIVTMEMNVKQGDNDCTQKHSIPNAHADNFNPFNFSDFRNNPLHLEPRLQHVGEDLENGTLMLNF
jgi:hypothetical protein